MNLFLEKIKNNILYIVVFVIIVSLVLIYFFSDGGVSVSDIKIWEPRVGDVEEQPVEQFITIEEKENFLNLLPTDNGTLDKSDKRNILDSLPQDSNNLTEEEKLKILESLSK